VTVAVRAWALVAALSIEVGCHRGSAARAPAPSIPISIGAAMVTCPSAADCERRCMQGTPAACIEAGRLYEFGHAGPPDAGRAFPLYERACTLGDLGGCYNAAILLELGRGVSKDTRRAAELYGRVCRMGSQSGCRRAEDLTAVLARRNE
jgi:TPR repeat protein